MKKPTKIEKEFGQRVVKKRHRYGMTQQALADCIGVSRETIANIERGHQRTMLIIALNLRDAIGVRI